MDDRNRFIFFVVKKILLVDSRGFFVFGKDGRVINDGIVFGVVNYIYGDELCVEGKYVEFSIYGFVGFCYFFYGFVFYFLFREFEYRGFIFFGS